jgi:hypothetical protein
MSGIRRRGIDMKTKLFSAALAGLSSIVFIGAVTGGM